MMERWTSTMTTKKTGKLKMKPSRFMVEKMMISFNSTLMNSMSKKDSYLSLTYRKSMTRIRTLSKSQRRSFRS